MKDSDISDKGIPRQGGDSAEDSTTTPGTLKARGTRQEQLQDNLPKQSRSVIQPLILGDLSLPSATTQTTVATTGSGAALPLLPSGYLVINIGNANQLIPYYDVGTGTATGTWLPLTGGTMSGNIAMGTNKLTGLGAGTVNGDSLRYEQLIGLYLLLTGGTMSGNIVMGTNKLTGLGAGTVAGDSLRYEQLIGLYLLLTGGTMSGAIAMGTNKVTGLAAATANGDAVRYEQWHMAANVQYVGTTTTYAIPTTSFVPLTNLAASITPKLTTSTILIRLCIEVEVYPTSGNKQYINIQLLRGGSQIKLFSEVISFGGAVLASDTYGTTVCLEYLDSPASTSSVSYTTAANLDALAGNGTGAINGASGASANTSSITLMEIPA
jgi:hypothetical protein